MDRRTEEGTEFRLRGHTHYESEAKKYTSTSFFRILKRKWRCTSSIRHRCSGGHLIPERWVRMRTGQRMHDARLRAGSELTRAGQNGWPVTLAHSTSGICASISEQGGKEDGRADFSRRHVRLLHWSLHSRGTMPSGIYQIRRSSPAATGKEYERVADLRLLLHRISVLRASQEMLFAKLRVGWRLALRFSPPKKFKASPGPWAAPFSTDGGAWGRPCMVSYRHCQKLRLLVVARGIHAAGAWNYAAAPGWP